MSRWYASIAWQCCGMVAHLYSRVIFAVSQIGIGKAAPVWPRYDVAYSGCFGLRSTSGGTQLASGA